MIATGGMVARALEATERLSNEGLDLSLVNLSTLKPAPAPALSESIEEYRKVATVEEHFVTGGLGSLIADVIAEAGLGTVLIRIGVNVVFPDRYAPHEENLRYVGLDSNGVAARLKEFF